MGREVRRVPKDWEHPRGNSGHYQPLLDDDYQSAVAEWKAGYEEWKTDPKSDCEYWEWEGNPPEPQYYMPAWPDSERTHFQMYETTSEGTPISPPMETPEALAQWLVDNDASAFAGQTASYESWLRVARGGFACSAVISGEGVLASGVEALSDNAHQLSRLLGEAGGYPNTASEESPVSDDANSTHGQEDSP